MNSARTSPRSTSVGGSANGLPDYIAGSRLFPNAGGSFQAQRASVESSEQQRATSALGVVMTPDMTLEQAIALASDQKGAGGRIFVSEGVWDFGANGSLVAVSGLEIIALSPYRTVFRRMLGASAGTIATFGGVTIKYPILFLSGSNITVRGITFLDAYGTAPAVLNTGATNRVEDCRFQNAYYSILSYSANGARYIENLIEANRATYSILGVGTASRLLIAGNKGAGSIVLTGTTTASTIAGNVLDASATITYTGGSMGNVHTGNVAAVNEEGSYTLADNTVAATDVPSFPTWDVTVYRSVRMTYQITRGATPDVEAGELQLVMNSAECDAYVDAAATATPCGVALSGVIAAGVARLQFTTTNTGAIATLKILSVAYGSP